MFCSDENDDKTSKTQINDKLIYVSNIYIINNCKGSRSCNPEPGY